MDNRHISAAISEIESEIRALTEALNVLRNMPGHGKPGRKASAGGAKTVKRYWSPEARKAAAARARKRWAEGKMGPKSKRA